jgi:hypothetical protein
VIEEAEGLGGGARLTHPIRCRVSGGYTISKLQGFRGADSPESLLTCILQVSYVEMSFCDVLCALPSPQSIALQHLNMPASCRCGAMLTSFYGN